MLFLLYIIFGFHLSANEGVSTKIDVKRLNEVKEWVQNSKYTLDTELENATHASINDHEYLFIDIIDRILESSGKKSNEFLMRNILYRAKIVYEGLREIQRSPKRDVLARRILQDGLEKAQLMYEPDLNLLKAAREGSLTETLRGVEFAKLGIEWADYMLSLYYLAPTNQMKLQLMKDMIGLMYNDILNDDQVNRILAPIAGAIAVKHEQLENIQPRTKKEILLAARDLRKFAEQQVAVAKRLLAQYNVEFSEPTEPTTSPEVLPPETSQPLLQSKKFLFYIGETVVYGTAFYSVVGVNSDGTYKIQQRGYSVNSSDYKSSALGKTKGESQSFRVGDSVISGATLYTIVAIHEDGTFKLQQRGYSVSSRSFRASELALTSGRGKEFSVGDTVIYGTGYYTIVGITLNGKYKIQMRGYSISMDTYSASQLARTK